MSAKLWRRWKEGTRQAVQHEGVKLEDQVKTKGMKISELVEA